MTGGQNEGDQNDWVMVMGYRPDLMRPVCQMVDLWEIWRPRVSSKYEKVSLHFPSAESPLPLQIFYRLRSKDFKDRPFIDCASISK